MRLIDADNMRQDWLENGENEYVYDTNAVLDSIDEQPTVDAVPVVHGYWERLADCGGGNYFGYCSRCKTPTKASCLTALKIHNRYCSWCGAKMDGDADV